MLSRVSNSLYSLARNIERADNTARRLGAQINGKIEHEDLDWSRWVSVLGANGNYQQQYEAYDATPVIDFLFFSNKNPASILTSAKQAREDARAIRETIPQELWEMVNTFYWDVMQYKQRDWTMDSMACFFKKVSRHSALFQGIVEATLSVDEASLFIKMGKYMERVEMTASILGNHPYQTENLQYHVPSLYHHPWYAVLQSVSGQEAYLKRHHLFVNAEDVIEFLLFNSVFPRSFLHCLEQLHGVIKDIDGTLSKSEQSNALQKQIVTMTQHIHTMTIRDVLADFNPFIKELQEDCATLGRLIGKTYYLDKVSV